MADRQAVPVIVVNVVHVTVAALKPEEKQGLLNSIKGVLVDAATTALATGLVAATVAIAFWVYQTLFESGRGQFTLRSSVRPS